MARITLVRKNGLAPAKSTSFDLCPGDIRGDELRKVLKIHSHEALYSIDCGGHICRQDGEVHDTDMIWLRDGREFFAEPRV